MEQAERIADRDLVAQIIVIHAGKARLLDMRVRGRSRMTATDATTGRTERIPAAAAWSVINAATGTRAGVPP